MKSITTMTMTSAISTALVKIPIFKLLTQERERLPFPSNHKFFSPPKSSMKSITTIIDGIRNPDCFCEKTGHQTSTQEREHLPSPSNLLTPKSSLKSITTMMDGVNNPTNVVRRPICRFQPKKQASSFSLNSPHLQRAA
jgi:hypothetical protein